MAFDLPGLLQMFGLGGGDPNAQAQPGQQPAANAAPGFFSDATGAYLGNLIDPNTARQFQAARAQDALLGLGAGLLALGPSRLPVPFGMSLGKGAEGMLAAQQGVSRDALQAAQTGSAIQESALKKAQTATALQDLELAKIDLARILKQRQEAGGDATKPLSEGPIAAPQMSPGAMSGKGGGWGPYANDAIDELQKLGASPAAIQGAMANGLGEGGFQNPWQKAWGDENSFGHWQLYQKGELPAYLANEGKDNPQDTRAQARFIYRRLNEIQPGFWKMDDPQKATDIFATQFEKYKGAAPGQRYGLLADAQKAMGGAALEQRQPIADVPDFNSQFAGLLPKATATAAAGTLTPPGGGNLYADVQGSRPSSVVLTQLQTIKPESLQGAHVVLSPGISNDKHSGDFTAFQQQLDYLRGNGANVSVVGMGTKYPKEIPIVQQMAEKAGATYFPAGANDGVHMSPQGYADTAQRIIAANGAPTHVVGDSLGVGMNSAFGRLNKAGSGSTTAPGPSTAAPGAGDNAPSTTAPLAPAIPGGLAPGGVMPYAIRAAANANLPAQTVAPQVAPQAAATSAIAPAAGVSPQMQVAQAGVPPTAASAPMLPPQGATPATPPGVGPPLIPGGQQVLPPGYTRQQVADAAFGVELARLRGKQPSPIDVKVAGYSLDIALEAAKAHAQEAAKNTFAFSTAYRTESGQQAAKDPYELTEATINGVKGLYPKAFVRQYAESAARGPQPTAAGPEQQVPPPAIGAPAGVPPSALPAIAPAGAPAAAVVPPVLTPEAGTTLVAPTLRSQVGLKPLSAPPAVPAAPGPLVPPPSVAGPSTTAPGQPPLASDAMGPQTPPPYGERVLTPYQTERQKQEAEADSAQRKAKETGAGAAPYQTPVEYTVGPPGQQQKVKMTQPQYDEYLKTGRLPGQTGPDRTPQVGEPVINPVYQAGVQDVVKSDNERIAKTIIPAAEAANQTLETSALIRDLLNNVATGYGADAKQSAAKILTALGVPQEGIKNMLATNAADGDAIRKMFLQQSSGAVRLMGAREPGSVISLFANAYPSLNTEKDAIVLMQNVFTMQAKRAHELAAQAQDHQNTQLDKIANNERYTPLGNLEKDFNKGTHSATNYLKAAEAMSGRAEAWKGMSPEQQAQVWSLIPSGTTIAGPKGPVVKP